MTAKQNALDLVPYLAREGADQNALASLMRPSFLTNTEVLNPSAIWAAIKRNRWIVLSIIGTALALGVLSILLARPVYTATASVQIDQQIARVLGTEDREQYATGGDAERFLQTQMDILKSRDLAERVVAKLNLGTDPAYRDAMGLRIDESKPQTPAALRDQAVAALQLGLDVKLQRLSRVAQVSIGSRDASMSSRLANAYVDAYIYSNLQRKFDQSTYSRKFLQDQLAQTRVKLEQSEQSMVSFARAAGLIELAPIAGEANSGGQSLVTSDLIQLNQSLATAKAARISAEQQWSQAQSTPLMSIPEVLTNPVVQELSKESAAARVELRQMQQQLGEDHPTIRQKTATVQALESELARQATAVKNSIRDRFLTARKSEGALSGTVSGLKGSTLAERDKSIQYNILKREVDTNRALYEALLQRYKEVSAEAGVTTNNISVVDVAIPPKRATSPRPVLAMGLALVLGLAAAAAWVYFREQLTDAVRTPDDVQAKTGLPLLGVTPLVPVNSSPAAEGLNPKSPFSEAINALRTSLELSTPDGAPRSLAFTSARPTEGKSTLAMSLARSFAAVGKRVVLVDVDLRAPSQHRNFKSKNKVGLTQVLSGHVELAAAFTPSGIDNLDVITSGALPPDPTLLLDGPRFTATIAQLLETYELVLLDCPPVLGLADAIQVGTKAAATIMVIEANDSRFANIRTALARLAHNNITLLGAVLSKFDAKQYGYGEYYGYYYSSYEGGE